GAQNRLAATQRNPRIRLRQIAVTARSTYAPGKPVQEQGRSAGAKCDTRAERSTRGQKAGRKVGNPPRAKLAHVRRHVPCENVDEMRRSRRPEGAECVVKGAAQHDEIGAEGERAADVEPAFDPAVEDHRKRGGG